MSFRTNVFANYLSRIYVTIIGIVTIPLYIRYMGVEAFGLVGFFAMLQAWFNLLDMGLTPTIARETARFCGGATDGSSYRRLVRLLELVFLVVAVTGGGLIYLAAARIASEWLQVSRLPLIEVQRSIEFMAMIIAMRWMSGLYRGTITGSERQVWLGVFDSVIASVRFLGVLPFLIFLDAAPTTFFGYQLVVALVEIIGLVSYSYCLMPKKAQGQLSQLDWVQIRPVIKFSLAVAFTSTVWLLVTQTDKLILSNILTLSDYGYFTLAVLVAGGVLISSGPVSIALMPRMSRLEALNDDSGLILVYRQATQLVAVLAGATSISIVFFAEPLLWVWTGDAVLAENASTILILYAIGNGILSVSGFPYYLQYAKGDLRLHLIGNAIFVVLLLPSIIYAANHFGGVGAGYVWLGLNLLTFVAWLPLVHRRFAPGLNLKWYGQDILLIVIPAVLVGYALSNLIGVSDDRMIELFIIAGSGLLISLSGAAASSETRKSVRTFIGKWRMPRGGIV